MVAGGVEVEKPVFSAKSDFNNTQFIKLSL
jgi:hypothetical protein